jgi:hypothetical protein
MKCNCPAHWWAADVWTDLADPRPMIFFGFVQTATRRVEDTDSKLAPRERPSLVAVKRKQQTYEAPPASNGEIQPHRLTLACLDRTPAYGE